MIPYDDVEDAIRIGNDSDYGLSGSVWSSDVEAGLDIARRIRTGTYTVNGFAMELGAPFGGFKSSGLGRELGPEGLAAYLEPKQINLPMGRRAAAALTQSRSGVPGLFRSGETPLLPCSRAGTRLSLFRCAARG